MNEDQRPLIASLELPSEPATPKWQPARPALMRE